MQNGEALARARAEGRPDPDFRPKDAEEKRLRRARALAREADELRAAAAEKRVRPPRRCCRGFALPWAQRRRL